MADNDFFERRCLYKMQRKALRLQFLTEKSFHGFLYKVCVVVWCAVMRVVVSCGLLQPPTASYSLLQHNLTRLLSLSFSLSFSQGAHAAVAMEPYALHPVQLEGT